MSLRLLGRASRGCRRVIGIGGQDVLWVAGRPVGGAVSLGLVGRRRCVGGAVSLGLVGRASRGWRCGVVVGGESVAWVALCLLDWCGGRRPSCGWRCAVRIGGEGVVWVALCVWWWLALCH